MLENIIVVILLIIVNGIFAAMEIAFISLNDNKIKKQAEEGDKKSQKISKILKEPSKFLATIQIGITLAGFLASAFAADNFAEAVIPLLAGIISIPENILRNIAVIIITMILSYFTLVFGELVPKRIAMKYCEPISRAMVGFISGLSILTRPFVMLLTASTNFVSGLLGVQENEDDQVTEEEIRMMVDVGEESGTIEPEEKEMINNIFELNDTTVEEIMIPRIDVISIDINSTVDEIIETIDSAKFSRVPVYEENIDNIVGILNIKELIPYINKNEDFKIKEIIKEPFFVPDTKKVHELFKEMKRNQCSLAVVLDEYGGTAGIVTMEDILEEIVGNIFDEYDEIENEYEKVDENTYIMEGTIRLDDVAELLDVELPTEEYDTLSGYIIGELGRIPEDDEQLTIEVDNLNFKVEKCEEKRIEKVKVCKINKFNKNTKEEE